MSNEVLVALITGGLSLAGVVISNLAASHKTETVLRVNQAITDTRLQNLTDEVRKHNNFAQRMPVVEEQIKTLQKRLEALEGSGER